MPIYEYECGACGATHEFIQKFSEGPKRKCPSCGALRLKKKVSAAAFHLKGSGWYVTDFRDGGKKGGDSAASEASSASTSDSSSSSSDSAKKDKKASKSKSKSSKKSNAASA